MNKLVEEAPYHPGYEDAVVSPAQKYKGVDPAKMIWKTKPLTDEVFNKAFDYYCETDEGVLRFDLELRTEWKQEQLQRWKEAFRKALK